MRFALFVFGMKAQPSAWRSGERAIQVMMDFGITATSSAETL
jgi:hypothetical protein